MGKRINFNSPSLATHYLRILAMETGNLLSTGTGFLYEFQDEIFMITTGHNVTGMDPTQTKRLSRSAAFPSKLITRVRRSPQKHPNLLGISEYVKIDLYADNEFTQPLWYIHPEKKYLIDVVSIPFAKKHEIKDDIKLFPINNYNFDTDFDLEIADDVFILGYPFDIIGDTELPIWKRGTIASEPFIEIDNLPIIYVDTATRSGMSGSPVLMRRTGLHGFDGKQMKGKEIIGTIQNFVGIYSGRIGADKEFEAQLGIIWKERVIEEIIKGRVRGDIEFQNKYLD